MTAARRVELTLVRHGETLWNVEGRMQGHGDSPLSERGRLQAEALAGALSAEGLDALYSSDLRRALDTARPIAAVLGLPVRPDARLRERHLGVLEGRTFAEVARDEPELLARWQGTDPAWVVPGGESKQQKHARVVAALASIVERHAGERVLAVTHGGGLDAAFRHALRIPLSAPRRFSLLNASLNVLLVEDGTWSVRTWGDVRHLSGLETRDDD
jgi:probable phosphoglycerate mutase